MSRGLAQRIFALVLNLFPAAFLGEYGEEMQVMFARRAAEARRRGRLALLRCIVRESSGVFRAAVHERFASPVITTTDREALSPMEHLRRELQQATRRLVRTPGFTIAAILSLALAIGANTAIFALLHRIVLSPLPYPAAERLVQVEHGAPGVGLPTGLGLTLGLARQYAKLPSTESIAPFTLGEGTLTGEGDAERIPLLITTPALGPLLGARPILGRWFNDADGRPGAPNVAVLSHAQWQQHFRGAPGIVGKSIRLDGDGYEVIGVLPSGFTFPDNRARIIVALQVDPNDTRVGGFNFGALMRLTPGASIDDARRQQNAVIADLPALFPADLEIAKGVSVTAKVISLSQPYTNALLGDTARTLWILLAAVAIVLLIACANLANLFLVRTDSRMQEVAVRQALGAGTGKVAAYFFGEAILVAITSGAVGLTLGTVALKLLVRYAPVSLPRVNEVRIDAVVIGFTVLASALAALTFGLMPLMRRRPAVANILQDSGRGNSVGRVRLRSRQVLMATQVSLAVVLLVAAGLMGQSFYRMQHVDPGFRAESRLVFQIGLAPSTYRDAAAAAAFNERFLERLRSLPGVEQAALTTTLPLDGEGSGDPLDVRGRPAGWDKLGTVVRLRTVSTDYFSTMGIPLIQGRVLDADDMRGQTNAVLLDEIAARQYFPAGDALGQQVRTIGAKGDEAWLTVVGVVGNSVTMSLRETAPIPKLYKPLRTRAERHGPSSHVASYVVRTNGSPIAQVSAVRRVLAELDPNVAMARAQPLTDLVDRAGASLAFAMVLLVLAASVALLLGVLGVYAVISYGVAQRTGEIGVRLALGARPSDVTGLIVRQSGTVIALGVALGLLAAVAAARLLQALLFGVVWHDALTYVAVAFGLFGVALLASWIPARRAAGLSPTEAMRRG
ncbi:MAG: ABC transporter permease [Cytophagaceae bacterium]|nr:ABC transporter permease [Gemmatimonadaceae bacterium]